MNINRVPERYENPYLFAAVPHNATSASDVIFCFPDGTALYDDGEHNLYRVWASQINYRITVEAVMWFTDKGLFRLTLSEEEANTAVFAADSASKSIIEACGY